MEKKTVYRLIFRDLIWLVLGFMLSGSLLCPAPFWGIEPIIVHAEKTTGRQVAIYLPVVSNSNGDINQPPGSPDPRISFINSVINGQADIVRGIYSASGLSLKVEQQPAGNAMYVSTNSGVVTQFGLAKSFNVIGLLAHNSMAGGLFFKLNLNELIDVIFGNGTIRTYRIITIERFQALQPFSVSSQFLDLANGENLSATELFVREYTAADQLVFQTCITENGLSTWGRFFVRAIPAGS